VAQWGTRDSRTRIGFEIRIRASAGGSSAGRFRNQDGLRQDTESIIGRERVGNINHVNEFNEVTTKDTNINASREWSKASSSALHFTKQKGSQILKRTSGYNQNADIGNQTDGKGKCQVCGRTNHDAGSCRFINYSFHMCWVVSHLVPMCGANDARGKGTKHKSQNNFLTAGERSGDQNSSVKLIDSFFALKDISRVKHNVAPYQVNLVTHGL